MKKTFILPVVVLASTGLFAQALPDLFKLTPENLLPSRTIAAYPKNTWLENMVLSENGVLFVTDYPEGKVFKVNPDGKREIYASVGSKIAGIALLGKGRLLVAGWDKQDKASLFTIDERRQVSQPIYIEGGIFPNGILHFHEDKFLIADSYAGCIWLYDADSGKVTVWLKSKLLERSSPKASFPAANGLKMNRHTLYVSNTEKQTIITVPLTGYQPGTPALFLDRVNVDDFTFDDAGNIYAATNVYNSVIKITPAKKITIVANLATGAAGSTSVVFARTEKGKKILYVATNGGMGVAPPTGVESGKIIELLIK